MLPPVVVFRASLRSSGAAHLRLATRLCANAAATATASSSRRPWRLLAAGSVFTGACAYGASRSMASAPSGSPRGVVLESLPAAVRLSSQDVKLTLFQFEGCPFCRKARAVLDYQNLPYDVVEVHPLSKKELKEIAPDYPKVPVLLMESASTGEAWQLRDSKTIVDSLMAQAGTSGVAEGMSPAVTSTTGLLWTPEVIQSVSDDSLERKWIVWSDKVLVQVVVMNIYRTWSESQETFEYLLTHPSFSWFEKMTAAFSGTAVMWLVANSRLRKYKIQEERKAMCETLDLFVDAIPKGARFLGGQKPCAADFNIYGIVRSMEGFATERYLEQHARAFLPNGWYRSMQDCVGACCARNHIARGPDNLSTAQSARA